MNNSKTAIALLSIIYTVGIIGIMIPSTRELTLGLTPVNLLVSLFFLLIFHEKITFNAIFSLIVIGCFGFILEVAGVATKAIFGAYAYGDTLGWRVWDVPILMAINWIVPIYCTRLLAEKVSKQPLLVALLGAVFMTALDFLLEPVAIFMDMWTWRGNDIPLENYLVWFVASFIIHYTYQLMDKKVQNKIAIPLLSIQTIFFGLLFIYILLT